jgi:hypothetical protein
MKYAFARDIVVSYIYIYGKMRVLHLEKNVNEKERYEKFDLNPKP